MRRNYQHLLAPFSGNSGNSDARSASGTARAIRWRWYHVYFILALFDIIVILASLFINHMTLESFDEALVNFAELNDGQEWLDQLANGVIRLNAPGNDVFETRDVKRESENFEDARSTLFELLDAPPHSRTIAPDFVPHVRTMIAAELRIFEAFTESGENATSEGERRELIAKAANEMAAMDRAQAGALQVITRESKVLLIEQKNALDRHKEKLEERSSLEYFFIIIVAFILAGVFWYGRQLQNTHESLLLERERVGVERMNRMAAVGEVCFACAHGIQNPVASIASSAQLITEYGQLDEESRDRIKDISTACSNLTHRVVKLLSFARAPAMHTEKISASEPIEEAILSLKVVLAQKNIIIRKQYDDNDLTITADRTLLAQSMIELISNAMDQLSETGGVVTVVCTPGTRPGTVELGVIDNGPGIPENIREQVCDLFFSKREGGSGIGLASVKRTAEIHHGTIQFRDASPSGLDVRIVLPIQ
jgi:signal transduction histidine kinase